MTNTFEISMQNFDKETQKKLREGFLEFLGVVAGLARKNMANGVGFGVRSGYLAESIRSTKTPKYLQNSIPKKYPSGWNARKHHIEKVTREGDSFRGEIGTSAWYAKILAEGGRAGKTGYIKGFDFMNVALEEARQYTDQIFGQKLAEAIQVGK